MSDYAVFFDYNNKTYRLPVNPEEINITSVQAIEKYEILKLGQIAEPTHMELKEYSFEAELPRKAYSYVETSKNFKTADYYLNKFQTWRTKLVPVRFIAGKITNDNKDMKIDNGEIDLDKCINTLVLIEELIITEKAGEEGDKYVSFKLIEYREFGKKSVVVKSAKKTIKKKVTTTKKVSPKANSTYVVKSGDSLWAIAKKLYGDGAKANILYNANKNLIKNPNLIKVGQKLTIPTEAEFSKYNSALPSTKKSSNKTAIPSYSSSSTATKKTTTSHSSGGRSFEVKTKSHSGGGRSFNIKTGSYSSGGRSF